MSRQTPHDWHLSRSRTASRGAKAWQSAGRYDRLLRLELLEERLALTVLIVNSLEDGRVNLNDTLVTLRDAIHASNTDQQVSTRGPSGSGADEIQFQTGLSGTITLHEGPLILSSDLAIKGPGASALTVDGNDASRVFEVSDSGASVKSIGISGLTISGGNSNFLGGGGGILNQENLIVMNSTLRGNLADLGGGIQNEGTLLLLNSTLSGNFTRGNGGGIVNFGPLLVVNSTLSGNSAGGYGGGIRNSATMTVLNSTITLNRADIYNSAVSGGNGGGISLNNNSGAATATLENTIVADNFRGSGNSTKDDIKSSGVPLNVAGTYNLIGVGGSGGLMGDVDGNQVGVAIPGLGPLTNNGGQTETHGLLRGSPAIDAGVGSAPLYDQRGAPWSRVAHDGSPTDYVGLSEIKFAGKLPGAPGATTVITPTQAFASSYYALAQGPINLINNLGLDTSSGNVLSYTHAPDGIATGMWHAGTGQGTFGAAPVVADQYVVFDLGANYDLSAAYIWQMSQTGLLGRGIKEFHLLASSAAPSVADVANPPAAYNLTGFREILGAATLFRAPMSGSVPTQTFLVSGAANVRQIYLDVVSDHNEPGIDIGAYERQTVAGLNLMVDALVDESNGNYSSGDLSLREAIALANGNVGPDTITFAAAVSGQTIFLGGTELVLSDAVTIDATALGGNVTINAQQNSRIFDITAHTGDFNLGGLTLTGGRTKANVGLDGGGAIRSATLGNLTLTQSTISGNSTAGSSALNSAAGGGILANGAVTLTQSTIKGNSTVGYGTTNQGGGGIFSKGDVTLTQSTISGNSTTGDYADGGGIKSYGAVNLTQSTISGNSTAGYKARGGGIMARGEVTITQCTISNNSTAQFGAWGGGLYVQAHATLSGSIVAGNTAALESQGADLFRGSQGTLTVNYSLIGVTLTGIVGIGNFTGVFPLLGLLANNGGPTQTHALLAGSMAIDAGDPSIAFNATQFDARGAPFVRVVNGDGSGGARIDMGAFELQQATIPSADFDSDFDVDGIDFLTWQRGLGAVGAAATRAIGNADGDGDVDEVDLSFWKTQFGNPPTRGAAAASLRAPRAAEKEAWGAAVDSLLSAGDFTALFEAPNSEGRWHRRPWRFPRGA